jgi:cell division septal protein FtsQ
MMQQNASQSLPGLSLHQRNKRKRIHFLLTVVIGGVLLAASVFFLKRVMVVQTIQCSTQQGSVCPEAVLAEASQMKGKSLFANTSVFQKKVTAAMTEYQEARVERIFPSTIKIALIPSSVRYGIYSVAEKKYILINQDGKIVSLHNERPQGLSFLEYEGTLRFGVGEEMNLDLRTIADQVSQLPTGLNARVARVVYRSPQEIVMYVQQAPHFFLSADRFQEQLDTLQGLLSEATMIESAVSIDLRFTHPVIKK